MAQLLEEIKWHNNCLMGDAENPHRKTNSLMRMQYGWFHQAIFYAE